MDQGCPDDREGLTICDATSAIFAMPIEYKKCDVLTWSWQKVLGGEAAHGMIALSPRAVERLLSYVPEWPIPKAFRLAENKKLLADIFEGNTINTPSMMCVEDILDTLQWVKNIGGIEELFNRSDTTLKFITDWIENNSSFEFMNNNKITRSNTGITFQIKEDWFKNSDEAKQREVMNNIFELLYSEKVAYDLNGYPKAPPSFRIWGGATVEPRDVEKLLPWITWSLEEIKSHLNE